MVTNGNVLYDSGSTSITHAGGTMSLVSGTPVVSSATDLQAKSESLLNTVTSIDMKTQAATTLLNVAGTKCIITRIIFRITTADTIAVQPQIEVGLSANYDEWQSQMTLPSGITAADKWCDYGLLTTGLTRTIFSSGNAVAMNVVVGATATTYTCTAYVYGYYLSS